MSLQLSNNLITIRERNLLEIMDLALALIRAQGLPLLAALAVGVVPMLIVNDLLLSSLIEPDWHASDSIMTEYFAKLGLLVMFEMPLAAAPATLYLGQSMFHEQTSWRQIGRDLLGSLPQLFWLQIVFRGIFIGLFFFVLPPIIPFIAWPYLNEIILLERNRLLPKKGGRPSTLRRSRMLHGGSTGDLMARWLGSLLLGGLLVIVVWMSLWSVTSQLAGGWISWAVACRVFLPAALWTVISFFTVVRFLSYLDLRIRREGWEVELALRGEATQMAQGTL